MFKGTCSRGIYDNMKMAVEAIFVGKDLIAKVLLDECPIIRFRSAMVGKETGQYRLLSPMVAQTLKEDRERKEKEKGEIYYYI